MDGRDYWNRFNNPLTLTMLPQPNDDIDGEEPTPPPQSDPSSQPADLDQLPFQFHSCGSSIWVQLPIDLPSVDPMAGDRHLGVLPLHLQVASEDDRALAFSSLAVFPLATSDLK